VSVDFTHARGSHEFRTLNINPIVNGQRSWRPSSRRAFGNPNYLSAVNIFWAGNKSQYDAMTVKLERRLPRATLQAHYTLARAKAYGGVSMARGGAPAPQDAFAPLAEGNWDRRQRRASPRRRDRRVRPGLGHPALADRPAGERASRTTSPRAPT
jgi:hypothetical protein